MFLTLDLGGEGASAPGFHSALASGHGLVVWPILSPGGELAMLRKSSIAWLMNGRRLSFVRVVTSLPAASD